MSWHPRMRAALCAAVMLCAMPCGAGEKRAETWYGWQIATADAITVTATGIGYLATHHSSVGGEVIVLVAGGFLYVVVPPIIHGGQGQGTNAFESLLVRLTAPLVLGVVCKCGVGAAVGAGGAALADAALISWKPAPSWRTSTAAIAPYVIPRNDGATFGVRVTL